MRTQQGLSKATDGWLGWAIFLGVSWTWCIGMFLPVLLVHDYGFWAWVIFAVPNVVGAAAMAWTIDSQRSVAMVEAHRPAVTAFSAVTVAFQLFFAVWAFTRPPWQAAGYQGYLLGVVLVALAAMVRKSSRLLAIAILTASIGCALGMFHRGEARLTTPGFTNSLMGAPPAGIQWLMPVCLFGFLLCPYLDSTFHRARQRLNDRDAQFAFSFGFGVVFLAAIVLTLLYAKPVHVAIDSRQAAPLILRWIKVYWVLQLGFTIGVHLIGDDSLESAEQNRIGATIAIAGVGGAMLALAIGSHFTIPGETIYRCFLGFYGLLFPAYVWLCLLPGRGVAAPTRRAMAVFAVASLIAVPMFWLAFIGKQLVWAGFGVAVVMLARLLISNRLLSSQSTLALPTRVQQNSAPTS